MNIRNNKNLEIFIFTCNRAKYLVETIDNLLLQSDKSIKITILDNCSTDNTQQVCKKYEPLGVNYAKTEINNGWISNFNLAKKLASANWIILFHDDDFLHPNYSDWIQDIVKTDSQIVLIGSEMSFENCPANDIWNSVGYPKIKIFSTPEKFAGYLYQGHPFNFGSSVYRADILKKINFSFSRYGKVGDRPFLMEFSKYGKVCVLQDKLVQYRLHLDQDSKGINGPYPLQLAYLHASYYKILGANILKLSGRIFVWTNYRLLRDEYASLLEKYPNIFTDFNQYAEIIVKHGGSKYWILWTGYLIRKLKSFIFIK